MTHQRDLQFGEKVWIEPAREDVPVPYETRLRGGINSGQPKHPQFPARMNQNLTYHRVKKLTGPTEVVWSEWWRRRFNQGDIKLSSPPPAKVEKKKAGGDK